MNSNPRLTNLISELRSKIEIFQSKKLGEQNTKAALIEPILQALGWDTMDPDEVFREFKNNNPSSNPVDYALKIHRETKLLIEAKGIGEDLDDRKWIEQVVGYAAIADVRWCILTDGNTWKFVNSKAPGKVNDRIFKEVRISSCIADDQVEAAVRMLMHISRDNMKDGNLDNLWKIDRTDRRVQATLHELIQSRDKKLVSLLSKKSEVLTPKEVAESLRRLDVNISVPEFYREETSPPPPVPKRKITVIDQKKTVVITGVPEEISLTDSWTRTKPSEMILPYSSQKVSANNTWKHVYVSVCKAIYEKHPSSLKSLLENQNFSSILKADKNACKEPKQIADGIFAETLASADTLRSFVKRLFEHFGLPPSSLKVWAVQLPEKE